MAYYDYGAQPIINPWFGTTPPPQMPNQFQMPMQQPCQCENRFMWIQGKEAAKAYPVAPDKTIFFLDDKESYAYLKKTDKDGKTVEFKTFQLVEEKEPEPIVSSESNYISKEDFNTYSEKIGRTLNQLMEKVDRLGNRPINKPYKKEDRSDA